MSNVINFLEGRDKVYRRMAKEINRAFSRGDNDQGYKLFNGIEDAMARGIMGYLSMESLDGIGEMQRLSPELPNEILRRLRDEGYLNDTGGKQ